MLTPTETISARRDAVLVFADDVRQDLARRGWSRRFAGLLPLPALTPRTTGADVHVFFGGEPGAVPRGVPRGVHAHRQQGDGFAARLCNAVARLTASGYGRVVVVGRDVPGLRAADVRRAFAELNTHRLALGPDQNGGCWLIGLHTADAAVLETVQWQCGRDFEQLRAAFGVPVVAVLPARRDLSTPADLAIAAADACFARLLERVLCRARIAFARDAGVCLPPEHAFGRAAWQLPPPDLA